MLHNSKIFIKLQKILKDDISSIFYTKKGELIGIACKGSSPAQYNSQSVLGEPVSKSSVKITVCERTGGTIIVMIYKTSKSFVIITTLKYNKFEPFSNCFIPKGTVIQNVFQ